MASTDMGSLALLPKVIDNQVRDECRWYTALFSIKGSIWLFVRPLLLVVYGPSVFGQDTADVYYVFFFMMYSITGALCCIITMLWAQSMRLATGLINARVDR